jgi:hypothetical protein
MATQMELGAPYLLDGEVTFHVGEENYDGVVGSFVHFPRVIAHTFTIETPSARFLVLGTPGGFERMFELAEFGMQVVGPHPRALETSGRR